MSHSQVCVKRHCWKLCGNDPRDGMMLVCLRALEHDGACKPERDHLSIYTTPWHPCQERYAETKVSQ